jgi:hypothetical protein
LAGRVLLMIVYFLVRRVLGLAVLVFRRDLVNDAEQGPNDLASCSTKSRAREFDTSVSTLPHR